MDELWFVLEDWLSQHFPEVLSDLHPECSRQELDELECYINCQLPEDFKVCYQRHNGQKGETTGIFCGLPFLRIQEIYSQWAIWQELSTEDFATEVTGKSYPVNAIKPIYINPKWIPFAHDGSGNHLGIDLDPGSAGVVGQVINFGRDETDKFVLASSMTDFLAWVTTHYQRGNYQSSDREALRMENRSLNLKVPFNTHFLDIVPLLFSYHSDSK